MAIYLQVDDGFAKVKTAAELATRLQWDETRFEKLKEAVETALLDAEPGAEVEGMAKEK